VQSDLLDQSRDLRLSSAQEDRATAVAKAARQSREVQHQGSVCEHQAAQIDGHIRL
jgi:hypothetical protein